MRLARSCTVMVSGRITSRTTRTWSERSRSSSAWRRSRSRWRRTEASERVFSSSPSMAACTSMRPVRRPSPTFLGATTGTLRAGRAAPGRRGAPKRRLSSSSGRPGFRRSVSAGALVVSAPLRETDAGTGAMVARSASGRTPSTPWPRGMICTPVRAGAGRGVAAGVPVASLAAQPALALPGRRPRGAARRFASAASSRCRASASACLASLLLGQHDAPRPRGGALPRQRRAPRSFPARASARPRGARLPAAAPPARAGGWQARMRSAPCRHRPDARAGAPAPREEAGACPGVPGAGAGPGPRFLRTSTCTTFERPWLKDCLTDPASTVRPSSKRLAGRSERRPLA